MATQNEKNMAYGMQVRLSGLIRRGAPQDAIDSLREKYEKLMAKIESEEK